MDLLWPQAPEAEEIIKDDEALHDALVRAAATAAQPVERERHWRRLLVAAGFTPAEAQRLIFERRRPRDEGVVRQ
jgi:hypothetical protein